MPRMSRRNFPFCFSLSWQRTQWDWRKLTVAGSKPFHDGCSCPFATAGGKPSPIAANARRLENMLGKTFMAGATSRRA